VPSADVSIFVVVARKRPAEERLAIYVAVGHEGFLRVAPEQAEHAVLAIAYA
jgi:hypothetical protein